jgi:hypothetical protein
MVLSLPPVEVIPWRDSSLFEFLAFWTAKHPKKMSHPAADGK